MTKDELILRVGDLRDDVYDMAVEADDLGHASGHGWLVSAEDCLNRALASLRDENDDF